MVEPTRAYFASPPRCPSSSSPAWRSEQPIIPTCGAKLASIRDSVETSVTVSIPSWVESVTS
jgi:hypothetical protein